MSELRAIRIERGPQGFGGPLVIRPTEQKNKVMYITGGGTAPECLNKIVELSGTLRYLSTEKNSNSKRYAGR